ncbi:zinc finger protein 593 homolog [Nilaparvata lugens]|uniref:zinc finger protein 593 homolog n=1 Tax=Nilaparvata lugens TaxID=108931 RepID=UPI00193DD25F|nr:zinc finger protein 593 homolog [Nilaparvata lugens]
MPGPQKRKRQNNFGDTHLRRRWRTRRRTKDLDEIDHDIHHKAEPLLNQEIDVDRPGNAQFYCLHCARYFISDEAMNDHFRTKVHKRRLKALELEPYSIEESERAAGMGSYIAPKKRKMETQPLKSEQSAVNKSDDGDDVMKDITK